MNTRVDKAIEMIAEEVENIQSLNLTIEEIDEVEDWIMQQLRSKQ
jgi:L-asparaginase/Glu-tRNA(Gln) amidotransferase subunit D